MKQRGQGAIEYLLIIGAAILVVAIVIVAITSVVSQGKPSGMPDENRAANLLKCQIDINALGGANCSAANASACGCCDKGQVSDISKVVDSSGKKLCP